MKRIIIGLLMISALSFGAVKENKINMGNNIQRSVEYSQMVKKLSKNQQNELVVIIKTEKEINYKKSPKKNFKLTKNHKGMKKHMKNKKLKIIRS